MEQAAIAPLVEVEKVAVDHINVGTVRSDMAQTLLALTPLLTVLITAVGIVFTLCFQFYQTREQAFEKEDSDWRAALQKVSMDESSSAIGAFEMQSFLGTSKYHTQARSIAAAILPAVRNRYEFDVALGNLLDDTNAQNQTDIITVAYNLSNSIRASYAAAVRKATTPTQPVQITLQQFILDPETLLNDDTDSSQLDTAETQAWELDSVIHGLSSLWPRSGRRAHTGKGLALPKHADLQGIIFLNADVTGVDFTRAAMDGSYFIGTCVTADAKMPSNVATIECTSKAN
jgi:hypothetical protein